MYFGMTLRTTSSTASGSVSPSALRNSRAFAVLHTDLGVPLKVGRNCTIGHLVMLHGCEIGDNSLIGIKSVILNRARIGKNSMVGACSLVTEGKQFPDGVLIVGTPAKVLRELTPQEIQFITLSSQHYVQNAKQFKTKLKVV